MTVSLDDADRRFLDALQRRGPSTVQQFCAELGITATAIRLRLGRMLAAGWVIRESSAGSGRGRPSHRYRVSPAGRRLLGDNYGELARVLWEEVQRIEEPQIRHRLLERVRQALADDYGRQVNPRASLTERVRQLNSALADRGFSVETDHSGELPILREHNCPYLDLAEQDPTICQLEQAVFEDVLEARVRRKTRCLDGDACCEFEVVEAGE